MKKRNVLFITDKCFIDFVIPGGVQVCTAEFIDYFNKAGYELKMLKLEPTKKVFKRIKFRLGLSVYDRYDFDQFIEKIIGIIKKYDIQIIAFNQINLSALIPKVKPHLPEGVKYIGLSHGNESGDFLHEIYKEGKASIINTWKLGNRILTESMFYRKFLDGVIIISEHELGLNQWLGATNLLILPRILQQRSLYWQPVGNRIGFVGTLDHRPNYEGILRVAKELKDLEFNGVLIIVGGPENIGYDFEKKFSFIHYMGKLTDDNLMKEAASWSLFLNPIFWYSRGSSTKLAQALNWGMPVLTTAAGARGYILPDKRIFVNDHNPLTFAKRIIEVLNDHEKIMQLKDSVKQNILDFDIDTQVNNLKNYLA